VRLNRTGKPLRRIPKTRARNMTRLGSGSAGRLSRRTRCPAKSSRSGRRFRCAHNQLGFLSLQTGQIADAEKHLKAAISLDPQYAEAQNNLGVLYGSKARAKQRSSCSSGSRKQSSIWTSVRESRPDSSERIRFLEAEQALQNAVRIEPDNKTPSQRARWF